MELIVDHSSVFSAVLHFLTFLTKKGSDGQELTNSETGNKVEKPAKNPP